jgi:hypothetical protein
VVLDEDPLIERYLESLLVKKGYRIVTARNSHALELNSPDLNVLLVITNRPGVLTMVDSEVPMVYLAASPDPKVAAQFPICRMMKKPFRAGDLLDAVDELTCAAC